MNLRQPMVKSTVPARAHMHPSHRIVLIPIKFPFVSSPSPSDSASGENSLGGEEEKEDDLHRSREYSMKSGRQTAKRHGHHENDEGARSHVEVE